MNVPDYVWQRISVWIYLEILLILIALVGVIAIFVTIMRHRKEAKRIAEENWKKAEEFEREIKEHREKAKQISENKRKKAEEFKRNSQKNKGRIEAFSKMHF